MAAILQKTGIVLVLFCLQSMGAIYVVPPEHSSNQLDALEMKRNEYDSSLRQQSVKYPINNNAIYPPSSAAPAVSGRSAGGGGGGDDGGNGQTNNAMLAKTSQQRHHTSYDKNDDVVDDLVGVNGNSHRNENAANFENSEAHTTSLSSSSSLLSTDAGKRNVEIRNDTRLHSRPRRELSDWLIAPNTRWCGRGNTANGTYNHLGGASRADKCCRKHDHCKLFIPAMSNRYGLFNYRPYTMSHCNCDTRFRTCLKMAGDEDANTIGKLFFNMVDTQCFVLIKEHVCVQRATNGTCEQEHVKKKAYLRNNKRF